jgi:hypothetical protein
MGKTAGNIPKYFLKDNWSTFNFSEYLLSCCVWAFRIKKGKGEKMRVDD